MCDIYPYCTLHHYHILNCVHTFFAFCVGVAPMMQKIRQKSVNMVRTTGWFEMAICVFFNSVFI